MRDIKHRIVETNGIKMHIAEQGNGPLVVFCHGYPELWYSWRHQLSALSEAGFHAVAPDQRGYGQTDCPQAIDEYNYLVLTGDIVGLVHALGEEKAVIVGHDFGAPIAWNCALLRPDIFSAVGLISVPYRQGSWGSLPPTERIRRIQGDQVHYQIYHQEPGIAEKELEADVRKSMLGMLYSWSGEVPSDKKWNFMFSKSMRLIDTLMFPDVLPNWLSESDLEVYVSEFSRTGFRGGLNWYRNLDRNWQLTAFLNGAKIQQPSIFIAGAADFVIEMQAPLVENLENTMVNLKKKAIIPGAGHWVQQEKPAELNKLLIDFLKNL
ncbi:MAG: alpha/beta hydrolase [Dehalococcoidia bacterium]|jgi:pimeloyl-ACP methyl ester carboxylesterase